MILAYMYSFFKLFYLFEAIHTIWKTLSTLAAVSGTTALCLGCFDAVSPDLGFEGSVAWIEIKSVQFPGTKKNFLLYLSS